MGAEVEARLRKTLLPFVTQEKVMELAQVYASSHSCLVKLQEHSPTVTEAALHAVRSLPLSCLHMWPGRLNAQGRSRKR